MKNRQAVAMTISPFANFIFGLVQFQDQRRRRRQGNIGRPNPPPQRHTPDTYCNAMAIILHEKYKNQQFNGHVYQGRMESLYKFILRLVVMGMMDFITF